MNYWIEESYNTFLKEFPEYYEDSTTDYFPSGNLPSKLTAKALKKLNNEIDLPKLVGCEKHLVLHELLKDKSKDNFSFYLLSRLELDCEVNSYDKQQNTIFMKLAKRTIDPENYFGEYRIVTLFKRGYVIKEEDVRFVKNLYGEFKNGIDFEKWTILRYATILNDLNKFKIALSKMRELNTILSFKMNRPIGFNLPNLLRVAVNAIINYQESGDIILKSIEKFGQTENIHKLDQRKGTFERKRQEYIQNKPIQDKKFEKVVIEIFPDLE